MRQAERVTMLRAIDSLWVRHLTDLDALREGIGLRAYGQQDPLVAYRKEAFEMYEGLLDNVREIVRAIFSACTCSAAPPPPRAGAAHESVRWRNWPQADQNCRVANHRAKRSVPVRQRQKIQTLSWQVRRACSVWPGAARRPATGDA